MEALYIICVSTEKYAIKEWKKKEESLKNKLKYEKKKRALSTTSERIT